MKKGIYKVPGGKLIKTHTEDADGKIRAVKIMGDFFMHPEEMIDELEGSLMGTPMNQVAIASTIREFLQKNNVTLFGADPDSIALTIINSK